jgi:pSer/pThr/pTyr-binding forkhead associated (FHA) protein
MQPPSPSGTPPTGTLPITGEPERRPPDWSGRPDWVIKAREELSAPGRYLAYEEADRPLVVPLAREWTRIGRSLAADVRFDDATVSRRHALIVVQADGVRVLDDRSLNGVYVNGERVEWRTLVDGDEISVGRHSLWFLERSPATVLAPPAAALAD